MPSVEKIKEELQDVEILRGISSALLEVSSLKIRGLREDFERNKIFYDEVSDLYRTIKISAKRRDQIYKREGTADREIRVSVTSNRRFYGSLNRTVMDAFAMNIVPDSGIDYLVIGHTGRHFLESTDYHSQCSYLSFKDDFPTPKETEVFLERVKKYDKVILYYPRFVNIFKQDPSTTDITYTTELEDIEVAGDLIEQIYEPELPHILVFFETQVRRLLFTRIMLESELSRTAARLVKMNSTEDKATKIIKEKEKILRREGMILEDIRLLETFSSALQWKKTT
jgi:ATP synthase F1 gamma subunit